MKIISTKIENDTKNVSKATRNCILDVYVTYFCSLKCFLLKETGQTLMIYIDRRLQRPLLSAFGEFAQLYLFGRKSVIFLEKH